MTSLNASLLRKEKEWGPPLFLQAQAMSALAPEGLERTRAVSSCPTKLLHSFGHIDCWWRVP